MLSASNAHLLERQEREVLALPEHVTITSIDRLPAEPF
jgi:hypothetical protein